MQYYQNNSISKLYVLGGSVFTILSVLVSANIFVTLNQKPANMSSASLETSEQIPVAQASVKKFSFEQTSGKGSYYSFTLPNYNSADHLVCAVREKNKRRHFTVVVTNTDNSKTVRCYVNDYGPDKFVFPDRIIDLSPKAFKQISVSGTLSEGVLPHLVIESEE